jgi:hypothetical protein
MGVTRPTVTKWVNAAFVSDQGPIAQPWHSESVVALLKLFDIEKVPRVIE